jgi:hypothetical protein
MGKKDNGQKHSAPIPDTKVSPPSTNDLRMPSSISDLVEATNLSSTGIRETLNATSGQDAVVQIVTHPVMLALIVGVSLLVLNRR